MPFIRGRSRLRVGLAPGLADLADGTGHGNVWVRVLSELGQLESVKLLSKGRADVWLADGHSPPPEGRPLVVEVHEASWHEPSLRSLLHPEFADQIESATRSSIAAASRVLTLSEASRAQLIDAYGCVPDHVRAVSPGVDHGVFRPGLSGGRRRVGAPYVLSVALFHPRKNFAAVRRSVQDLADAGLPHRLAIVGSRPPDPRGAEFERQAIAELDGHPGRIAVFSGLPTSELAELMAGADVFCLPSLFEGFGLPALEAMACATPVVVSDRGALPEVVGDAGLLVSPEPREVSAAVRRVVSDPALAARLRAAGPIRAQSFSWRRMARGWLDVLRDAATEGPRGARSPARARRAAADP
jgi:glycosyltransferase involved in cell wall biosynthesis